MKKSEMKAYTEALVKAREILTDDQAREVAPLFPVYQEGTEYADGARVRVEDMLYRIVEGKLEAI